MVKFSLSSGGGAAGSVLPRGGRGLGFKSRHSDQKAVRSFLRTAFSFCVSEGKLLFG